MENKEKIDAAIARHQLREMLEHLPFDSESWKDMQAWHDKGVKMQVYPRSGSAWIDGEDDHLLAGWKARETIDHLSGDHERTPGAIVARLVRLGVPPARFPPQWRKTAARYAEQVAEQQLAAQRVATKPERVFR